MGDQFKDTAPMVISRMIASYFQSGFENKMQNLEGTARLLSDAAFEAPKAKYMEHLATSGGKVYELYLTHR